MKSFEYFKPVNLDEALTLAKRERRPVKFAAGCTNILPDISSGKLLDSLLIDISGLEELKGIKEEGDSIWIGSLTTVAELLASSVIKKKAQILLQTASLFADPLVRNQATIGGNLGQASPAADLAVPLLALEAIVLIKSPGEGVKQIPVEEFFKGPGMNSLSPGEIITGIRFKAPSPQHYFFAKLGKRNAMAVSLASCAVIFDYTQTFEDMRIALGALAPTPCRVRKTEKFLEGKNLDDANLAEAASILKGEINPISDIRGSREYRLEVAGSLFLKAIRQALKGEA